MTTPRSPEDSSHNPLFELPEPDADAQAHSERLIARIAEDIHASGGRISFARYMELALFAPGLGYYSAGSQKFGEQGDFVTAPEISPLFSRALARQIGEVLAEITAGDVSDADVLEVGGGTGTMAAEILAELENQGKLPQRYLILELSADLQARQRETLTARVPHLIERVQWLTELPKAGFRGVVVANELLDALPVHCFVTTDKGVQERFVTFQKGRFQWGAIEENPEALPLPSHLSAFVAGMPSGYASEINTAASGWVQSIANCLDTAVVFLIDYGYAAHEYYHPRRNRGTLMCHYRHRAHDDPFVYPGLQDITAHVDFTAIAEAAVASALEVRGYNTQGFFLLGCGITELVQPHESLSEKQQILQAQQMRTLTLPAEMGERFKVIALARNYDAPLRGFTLQDLRHQL
ncbi:MAG: SAM-dependent methyltransferase [Ectothiorhodospiraceae bacterium]|nr:SAM-dependent methyltransferase [Ectothiorhodospiraceae bacterium]